MTAVARSLDDLDRLAFRLTRTISGQYPHLLTQGFTLIDLEERLLPYRDVKRELADSGADGFERSLLRLIAGERDYVQGEPELQAACRRALALPSPTMALVRGWATAHLTLAGDRAAVASAGAATGAAVPGVDELFPAPSLSAVGVVPGATDARATSGNVVRAALAQTAAGVRCRYCDHRLPEGRAVTFCPHCGLDLTKRQCAACSTELAAEWKHCVTCGRGA